MKIERKSIIVNFNNKQEYIHRLHNLDVNTVFISKNYNYAVVYYDSFKEKDIKHKLSIINGFISFEETYILKEDMNFDENTYIKKDVNTNDEGN